MRLFLLTLLSSSMLILLSGCSGFGLFEDPEINLPEIEILSVSQNGMSTLVTVEVRAGSNPLELVGVSYNEEENFSLTENQNLYSLNEEGIFELSLEELMPERTYYFRAFVGGELVFSESQIVSFFVPRPAPPDIPCTLVPNQLNDRGTTYNQPFVTANDGFGDGKYGLRIESGIGGPILTVNFSQIPTSGIYQTSSFSALDSNPLHVYIDYSQGFITGSISSDQDVYVEKLDEKHYIISFCDMEYSTSLGSTIYTFSGQVEVD